jgi:hypothetical protein
MNRNLATLFSLSVLALCLTACKTTEPERSKLAPGQYEWQPGRSPGGPVLMVVSIDDQMAYVYRNGIQIGRSTVSTGREGKETPTGVFTVLQRKVEHESSIYKGAQMPYMQRLTWGGIAMHAGALPGYPASAGCVRLPLEFSEKIYSVMGMGGTVVITKKGAKPSRSSRPADVLLASRAVRADDRAIPDPVGKVVWEPGKSTSGPHSVLVSYADRTVYVWRNGIQIGQAPIGINGSNPPEGVFLMLEGTEAPDPRFPGLKMHPWTALSLDGGNTGGDVVATMRSQISLPDDFRKKINRTLTPGTILVSTRQSSNSSTRSSGDFTIMKPEGSPE